jgi:hypothetical protein
VEAQRSKWIYLRHLEDPFSSPFISLIQEERNDKRIVVSVKLCEIISDGSGERRFPATRLSMTTQIPLRTTTPSLVEF